VEINPSLLTWCPGMSFDYNELPVWDAPTKWMSFGPMNSDTKRAKITFPINRMQILNRSRKISKFANLSQKP